MDEQRWREENRLTQRVLIAGDSMSGIVLQQAWIWNTLIGWIDSDLLGMGLIHSDSTADSYPLRSRVVPRLR